MIHHINKRKHKNHMIILINTEKAFDKMSHHFVIKNTQNTRNTKECFQPDKGHL